ncbi:hypothetical protein SAY87_013128 [Trapa incisa]|uniref:Peroxidase n=1 Tax=Trapa incisa TaxID=236973 RepID=A0AAN7KIZ4_9MYRT|nr:hypothetical protein SAY87_013128 [Trapa incisa]
MALVFLLFLLLPYLSLSEAKKPTTDQLTADYYAKSCPRFHDIIRGVIVDKQIAHSTTAAATLRLFFHDCMVDGCDGSVLITSNAFNKAERDADINLSLPGDSFDLIVKAKTALELECPGTVSCSDILAVATRDLVTMVGGPFYNISLGRKDGFTSNAAKVKYHLAEPTTPFDDIISMFEEKGLDVGDMVALTGAHTIGFSHCKEFSDRLYHYSNKADTDPTYHPKYAEGLKKLCANYTKDPTMSAFNDVMTPNKFDNMYYLNLQRGMGLLASDQIMASDKRTKPFVDRFASNQSAFFEAFARAMEKVSVYGIKTGKQGEVRRRCDSFNSIST